MLSLKIYFTCFLQGSPEKDLFYMFPAGQSRERFNFASFLQGSPEKDLFYMFPTEQSRERFVLHVSCRAVQRKI
jgi:hypothetical protein